MSTSHPRLQVLWRRFPYNAGLQVNAGDPLFALESGAEAAARDQAANRLDEARAKLDDAKKGMRPAEIDAIEAQLNQAHMALVLSEKELARQMDLFRTGASAAQEMDRARSARGQDRQRVSQLEADLKTAQLGARSDQIAAAEAGKRRSKRRSSGRTGISRRSISARRRRAWFSTPSTGPASECRRGVR